MQAVKAASRVGGIKTISSHAKTGHQPMVPGQHNAGLAAKTAPLSPFDQVSGLAPQGRAEAIEGFQVHALGQISADAVYGYEMHPRLPGQFALTHVIARQPVVDAEFLPNTEFCCHFGLADTDLPENRHFMLLAQRL